MSELQKLYHETQKKQLCLLHALNNIFQRQEFHKSELDEICELYDERVWFNSHRSMLGLGNYDVNILLRALESRGLEGIWFDKRLSSKDINHEHVHSYIFNIPSEFYYIPFIRTGRHWFGVKRFGSTFYNLDSKLPEPVVINDFSLFANELLVRKDELILVCDPANRDKVMKNTDSTE